MHNELGASLRTAVVWRALNNEIDQQHAQRDRPLTVLDVGGGSGLFAVPLAELGHDVTVVDSSADALATLTRRATESASGTRVSAIQGDVDQLADFISPNSVDLVLCHNVLEVVDKPSAVLDGLRLVLRPTGCGSFLVANRAAAVLSRALGGHLVDAQRALTSPTGQWSERDAVLRRFTSEEFAKILTDAGFSIAEFRGTRVIADLIPGAMIDSSPGATDHLREFELAAADLSPYRDIASQLHILARPVAAA